ncbi:MAG: protein-(glutamine-N5) methyltransferase, release factor-specific [Acidimicrobiaceae bacterium]|nr:protein-(glutamine-N5) methyltransferase, release factor-specific [Acidimicrobiaceae bacterium]
MDREFFSQDASVNWEELLSETGRILNGDNAELEAKWMIEEVSGVKDSDDYKEQAKPIQLKRLNSLIERRVAGEPLQYVLGRWQFRELDLFVDNRVLIPRPETEMLVGYALEECAIKKSDLDATQSLNVVDLGCGSGAIGLSIVRETQNVSVWCTDISEGAISVARANLAGLGMAGQRVSISRGSWFEALPEEMLGKFDIIISNPPYIGDSEELPLEVSEWEPSPSLRSGPLGTEDLSFLLNNSIEWLSAEGQLILELAPMQADAMVKEAKNLNFREVQLRHDLTGRERVLMAKKPL